MKSLRMNLARPTHKKYYKIKINADTSYQSFLSDLSARNARSTGGGCKDRGEDALEGLTM